MSQDKENVNKLFRQFKNKYVSVDLRDNNQSEGKVIAIDNYLNLVLENENGFWSSVLKGILNGREVFLGTYGQNGTLTPGTTYEVNNRLIRHLHGEV